MADKTRGERTVQLFAKVISNPTKKFSISDLMESLDIPEGEKRNVQRDMRFLAEMDAGRYIQAESVGRTFYYSSALQNADRLLFPNFENTMLHFVFLRRIANIYPATSEIITQLLERIEESLPDREKKSIQQLGKELGSKILFMGTPPDFEEEASEKIRVILQAIHDHRKIEVEYLTENSCKKSTRIPLMIIVYQNDIYVGCESAAHAGDTYTLKFRRIKSVKLTKETFTENPKTTEKLRRQVVSGAAFLSGQEPKLEDIEIEFESHAKLYLQENPFNRSMQIGKIKDGKITVKMKAECNRILFNWVVSFSDAARVVKPAALKKKLSEYADYLKKVYG
jgi:predicted DNA-binding transcriptional regulator YafY